MKKLHLTRGPVLVAIGTLLLSMIAAHAAPPGSGWKRRWDLSDEFWLPAINQNKWRKDGYTSHANYSWPGANKWRFTNRLKNISQANNLLKITCVRENYAGKQWTSGIITSKSTIKYGFFESRFKCAPGSLNSAFWLWDIGSGNTYSHELDIQEGRGTGAFWGNNLRVHLHRWPSRETNQEIHVGSDTIGLGANAFIDRNFRNYSCWWDANRVRFYYQNTSAPRWIINHNWMRRPLRLRLSLGVFGNKLPNPLGATGSMYVDWVRSWQR